MTNPSADKTAMTILFPLLSFLEKPAVLVSKPGARAPVSSSLRFTPRCMTRVWSSFLGEGGGASVSSSEKHGTVSGPERKVKAAARALCYTAAMALIFLRFALALWFGGGLAVLFGTRSIFRAA